MDWKTYYDRFYEWEESTQLRYLAALTNFGPSPEVCELAAAFYKEASANRLIKKALSAGVHFTLEDISELDGVVEKSLMPELIGSVRVLTADELDEFSYLLTKEQLRTLAKKNRIRLDKDGYVITPEMQRIEDEERAIDESLRKVCPPCR